MRILKDSVHPLTVISKDVGYDVRRYRGCILLLFFTQLILLLTAVLSENMPFFLLAILCGGLIFALTASSLQRFLLLIIVYISVFTSTDYLTVMPVKVSFELTGALVFIALFCWLIVSFYRENLTFRITALDTAFAVFLFVTSLGAVIGFRNSNDVHFIREELFLLWLYVVYFLWVHSSVDKKWIRYFFWTIVGVSVIVFLEYAWEGLHRHGVLLSRIPTQQAHLTQISIPFLLLFLTTTSSRRNKLLALAMLIPNFIVVLLSQQRALWASVVITSLIIVGIYIFRTKSFVQRTFRLTIALVLIVATVFVGMYFIQKLTRSYVQEALGERAETFASMSADASLLIRYVEISKIWDRIEARPILGSGLGDAFIRRIRGGTANYVDNAYVYLLWKIGLVGLTSYLVIVFLFFRRCAFLLKSGIDEEYRHYTLAALIGFIGLLIIGLTNTCLTRYRFELIWAMLIGSVEIMARKIENRFAAE